MIDIWKNLKYFDRSENWGNPDKMNPDLLLLLDLYREKIGKPFIIQHGYKTTGHSPNSQHYLGKAVDGHFTGGVSLLDAYFMAEKIGFAGIGLYPDQGFWFIHLDNRDLPDRIGKRWIRDNIDGTYHQLNSRSWDDFIVPML